MEARFGVGFRVSRDLLRLRFHGNPGSTQLHLITLIDEVMASVAILICNQRWILQFCDIDDQRMYLPLPTVRISFVVFAPFADQELGAGYSFERLCSILFIWDSS